MRNYFDSVDKPGKRNTLGCNVAVGSLEMPEFEPQYMLVVDRVNNLDTLQVQVEVRKDFFSDDMGRMLAIKKALADRLKSVLSISADVRLMEPGRIERSQGKGKHVIDNRILK